jgi:hypothetical protein
MPRSSFIKQTRWIVELGAADGAHCPTCPSPSVDRLTVSHTSAGYDVALSWGCDDGDALYGGSLGDATAFIDRVLSLYPLDLCARTHLLNLRADLTKEPHIV